MLPAWLFGGLVSTGTVDPTAWSLEGWPTLTEPTKICLAKVRNRQLYAMLVSRSFQLPSAFAVGGAWRPLIRANGPTVAAPSVLPKPFQQEVRSVFKICRSQALPLRATQTVHRTHVCGHPQGGHDPDASLCPVCLAMGIRVEETDLHREVRCPLRKLVWRAVLSQLCTFIGGAETWADSLIKQPSEITPNSAEGMAMDVERGIVLGLRPTTTHAEPFALVRGLTIDALSRFRDATWHAMQTLDGPEPAAANLYRAAWQVYQQIRDDFQKALLGDYTRMDLLERRMRGAGLRIDGKSPTQRWSEEWIKTGVCVLDGMGRPQQLVMGEDPLLFVAVGLNQTRLVERPDMAPPTQMRSETLQVYISGAVRNGAAAWSVVAVQGNECARDHGARLYMEATGPLQLDASAATFLGAQAADRESAYAAAAIEAIDMLNGRRAAAQYPIVLRMPTDMARHVTGCTRSCNEAFLRALRKRWKERLGEVWIAGSQYLEGYVWADRAQALARHGHGGAWGTPDARWHPLTQRNPMGHGDDCCVCFETFTDPFPSTHPTSRAPGWLYACPHALCWDCDADQQRRGGALRCPLCRANRVETIDYTRYPWT